MKRRKLLVDGTDVSEIGLGCMSFAGFYGPTDEAESHRTLARAQELGIDFLDTANVYGMGVSERAIGNYIKGDPSLFRIATKASIWRHPETKVRGFNNKSDHLRSELEGSLRRLRLDRVDLFYIHRRDPEVEVEAVMETLLTLKEEQKIGGIGFSEISPATLRRAVAVGPVDAVQSEYSVWTRYPDLGVVQTCEELGVTFVPFSPVCRGIMGAEAPDITSLGDMDFRKNNPRFTEPNFSYNLVKVREFQAYAADLGTSAIVLCMAWVLARGDTMIPIPGTRSPAHLEELAAGSSFEMTDDIMAEIERILPVGWAHGDRYNAAQWAGPEGYC